MKSLVAPFLPLLVHHYLICRRNGPISALNLEFSDTDTAGGRTPVNRRVYFNSTPPAIPDRFAAAGDYHFVSDEWRDLSKNFCRESQ